MLGRIALFELRYQLGRPLVVISLVLFGLLGSGFVTMNGMMSGSSLHVNAPGMVAMLFGILSLFALFVPFSIFANVALRNVTSGMDDLIRSYPVPAGRYVLARFSGAYLAASAILLAATLGMLIGSYSWLIPADRIGPFRPAAYGSMLAMIGIPNLLSAGALFFAVATLTRSMMATNVSVAIFLFAYFATQMLHVEPAYRSLAALLDPFGIAAISRTTLYWTVAERNSRLIPLEGLLLWNRVLWITVSLVLLAISVALSQRRDRATPAAPPELTREAAIAVPATRSAITYGGAGVWAQLAARTRLEARTMVRSWIFVVLLALGAAGSVVALMFRNDFYGTPTLPVTTTIIESLQAPWVFVELIIVVAFAADLVWRERQTRIAEIIDVTPTPSWVFVLSKLAAVALVLLGMAGLAMVVGVAFQLINGVSRIEPAIYLVMLFVLGVLPMLMWAVLSIFVQTLVNRKHVGLLIMLLLVTAVIAAELLGRNNYLLLFGQTPDVTLSDMNRYGHFLAGPLWLLAYWGCVTALLGIAAHLLWVRGTSGSLAARLRRARRLVTPAIAGAGALAFLGTSATGGYFYWNTRILNTHLTKSDVERRSADYERTFRPFEALPQPRVTDIEMAVDLHPATRAFESRGRYILMNRSGEPIETVHVQFSYDVKVDKVELSDADLIDQQPRFNHFVFRNRTALAPGARRALTFESSFRSPGFKNSAEVTPVVHNGSFAHDAELAPAIGVPRSFYLKGDKQRRDHGLEPIETTPKLDDTTQHRVNYIRADSDFVRFALTLSTSADQVAIGPGYLRREWSVGDRRFFRYEMDQLIVNFWSVLSARYAVARDRWNDVDLAVYHHHHHGTNVPRMLDAVKQSLDYYSANFGPYQYRQLRILEFPRYASFAQSFPNTIPYSEGLGFIADNRDPAKIDYLWFVTAHEVAHQWWAHQVIGANVQGATLLSETLAEYSALMVMERRYGSERMRQLLKYELDKYLAGRGQAGSPEQPLNRVGMDQMHIHYHKGALAMYALKDAIGEATINRALARFLKEYAYRWSPYPTSASLIRVLREEAGDEHQQLITDLFERITLWDLGVTGVEAKETDGGQWQVRIGVRARKLHADGRGKETEAPLDQAIDIGLFAADPAKPGLAAKDVIALEKRKIAGGTQSVEFLVDRKPAFVGIDPYIKLISRDTSGNVVAVR